MKIICKIFQNAIDKKGSDAEKKLKEGGGKYVLFLVSKSGKRVIYSRL
jgi:hypothetical protein